MTSATVSPPSAAPAATPAATPSATPSAAPAAVPLAASGAALAATVASSPSVAATRMIADAEAARFLAQASMGASRATIAQVKALGFAGWIDAQMAMPLSTSRWDWLVSKGYNDIGYKTTEGGFDGCAWAKLLGAPDTLRQRVTLALSEITVVAIDGLVDSGWRSFSAAAYLDLLEANAFGNYRVLLEKISTSAPMGQYLTYRGNVKFSATTGALPDENYARELMQLFTIGLLHLNLDGTPQLLNGQPQETYGLADITGLARIFTGWNFDMAGQDASTPDFLRRPMSQIASRHETGASTFLGATVPAGLDGAASLKAALDIIFAHHNVGPFISRQLIQRLVTSNPSPGYVARVATVFNNDGTGVRGNLRAVIKALLLDDEARNPKFSMPNFGKLREPMLRFTAWARAYTVTCASGNWNVGNTSDPATRLGQSPLRSPTVFNFFRPGYVPPNTAIANAAMVAPEFQIANESSVVGYVNYMQTAVSKGVSDVKPDYSSLLPLADNITALLNEINTVLVAGGLSADTMIALRGALNTMPSGTDTARYNRIYAALTLVLATPEFIVQK